jgi:hypothetical protein
MSAANVMSVKIDPAMELCVECVGQSPAQNEALNNARGHRTIRRS